MTKPKMTAERLAHIGDNICYHADQFYIELSDEIERSWAEIEELKKQLSDRQFEDPDYGF